MKQLWSVFLLLCLSVALPVSAGEADFDGPLSRSTLEYYLSHAVTASDLLRPDAFFADYGFSGCFAKQLETLQEIQPLFVGRAMLVWAMEDMFMQHMQHIDQRVAQVHAIDGRIIVQGCIFEAISTEINHIAIPAFVFAAFELPAASRTFVYADMLFDDQQDQFGPGVSVPDITRQETRLWYYYVATLYLDAGFEAIHLGIFDWVTERDSDKSITAGLLAKIRAYAAAHARRHWVLLDAHTEGIKHGDQLLLDFHAAPLRLFESAESAVGVDISPDWPPADQYDTPSIYTRSPGGINPNGWSVDSNPFLVEFDHGYSQGSRELNTGPEFIDGLDEITWFSEQPVAGRNAILRYLRGRVPALDPVGHLQPCLIRQIWVNHTERPDSWYFAATADQDFPWGGDQTETLAGLFTPSLLQLR